MNELNELNKTGLPYLVVRQSDKEFTTYSLGEGAQYHLDALSQTLRVWDGVCTYLVGTPQLVVLRLPH